MQEYNSCADKNEGKLIDVENHWDNVYSRSKDENLGWYERIPKPSLDLIEKCGLEKDSSILCVGSGTTTLIDELIDIGYTNIIANDISTSSIEKLKKRLGPKEKTVKWLIDNLIKPTKIHEIGKIDLWHDRAVLHFFRKKEEQEMYFSVLKKLVKSGCYVIIAVFNENNNNKCSGLPVDLYSLETLNKKIGKEFKLVESFIHHYTMPSGNKREFIYTLYKRI